MIKARRGLDADRTGITFEEGEMCYTTDTKKFYLGDGSTAGGIEVGSSGVSDGDKGDITVSSSGTVWTIDNDAVTYAKVQNVSATDKLLGRSSAGAGNIEEITCTAFARSILDDTDEATFKATVNLEIGTDVQAFNAILADLAGLTQAANKLPYFDSGTTATTADLTAFGRSLIDDADAATGRTTLGAAASGANTDITSIYLNNTGLKIKDTNASHGLIIAPGSDITADRTLTIITGDSSRTITLNADTVLSGSNTGDQTSIVGITGTKSEFNTACSDGDFLYVGDITQYTDELSQDAIGGILVDTSTINLTYDDATPQITADVIDASITLAKMANVATSTVFYRKTAGTGVPEVQTLATLKTDLGLTGTNSGDQNIFQTIACSSGTNPVADSTTDSLNLTGGSGITVTGDSSTDTITIATTITQYTDELAQDAIGTILLDSTTIDFTYDDATPTITAIVKDDSITFAKIQNITDNRILGRAAGSSGDTQELTVSTPLIIGSGTIDFDETAVLGNNARVTIRKNTGADVGTRRRINFIEGSNVTLTVADDSGNEEVDITIAATGGGGGGTTVNVGQEEVDFGASETDSATVTVSAAWVTTTTKITCTPASVSTTDHSADEVWAEGVIAYPSNIINGVSFDIIVKAAGDSGTTWGKYKVNYMAV